MNLRTTRYRLLSHITRGKTREYYREKYKKLKNGKTPHASETAGNVEKLNHDKNSTIFQHDSRRVEMRPDFIFSATRQWNCGDEFILFGTINIIKSITGEFNPIIYNRNPDIRPLGGNKAFRNLKLPLIYDTDKELCRLDEHLRLGFHDNSIKFDSDLSYAKLACFAGSPETFGWRNTNFFEHTIKNKLPLMALGIGWFGNVRQFEKDVYSKALLVTVRDPLLLKHQFLKDIGAVYMPCPALMCAPSEMEKKINKVKNIALVLGARFSDAVLYGYIKDHTFDFVVKFYQTLIKKYAGKYNFSIICHYIDEIAIAHKLFDKYNIPVLYSFDSRDYFAIYSKFDFSISTRVHGCGISSSLGIPNINISHDDRAGTVRGFLSTQISDTTPINDAVKVFNDCVNNAPISGREILKHKKETRNQYIKLIKERIDFTPVDYGISLKDINYQEPAAQIKNITELKTFEFLTRKKKAAVRKGKLTRLRYRLLSHLTFGRTRQHYRKKYKEIKALSAPHPQNSWAVKIRKKRYNLLSHITFGKLKQHYCRKYNELKSRHKDHTADQASKPAPAPARSSWYKILNPDKKDITLSCKHYNTCRFPQNAIPVLPPDGGAHAVFNIDEALKANPRLQKIALIFFMGIGDYFFATNFLELLKQKYPSLALDAYVSDQTDANNSPLVYDCLKNNPNIANIYYFSGKRNAQNWKNYDYSEVLKTVDEYTLVLPMIYEHRGYNTSRTETLCQTFSLPIPEIINPPLVYPNKETTAETYKMFENIFLCHQTTLKKIVYLQLAKRSSFFTYPYKNELIQKFLDNNFIVVTADANDINSPYLFTINTKIMGINDSIELVRMLKSRHAQIYICQVPSSFTAISSALNIPNLCMQEVYDSVIRTVYFPNVFLVSHQPYPMLPTSRVFVASPENQTDVKNDRGNLMKAFKPDYVVKCFRNMLAILAED